MGIRALIWTFIVLGGLGLHAQPLGGASWADSGTYQATWLVALPFESKQDSTSVLTNYALHNRMATQFYTGLRAGVDSLNQAGSDIRLILVEHVESTDTYVLFHEGVGFSWAESLTPESLMAQCNRWGVEKIIGPFRGDASEALASYSTHIPVINPVSRVVDVRGRPYLWAAASYRMAEVERLGHRAASAKAMAPNSRTILLRTEGSVLGAENVFIDSYIQAGGRREDVIFHDFRHGTLLAGVASPVGLTRMVLLDDKVLVAARVLHQLRTFDPKVTEFWTLGNVLSSSALDAQLLMRQPLVWAQVERLDYIQFKAMDQLLYRAAQTSPGRWEWLGLDMAWFARYAGVSNPMAFEGPRRLYVWEHREDEGFRNRAALIFRYDRKKGIQAEWTPSIDYGIEAETPESLDDSILDSLGSGFPELVPNENL